MSKNIFEYPQLLNAVYKLWHFNRVHLPPKTSDVIVALGSYDLSVARYSAELFHEGFSRIIVFTGGNAHNNDLLHTSWSSSEATAFSKEAAVFGVDPCFHILETESQNTGENFVLSRPLIEARVSAFQSAIVTCKPYMERRAYYTAQKHWPDIDISVGSCPWSFLNYAKQHNSVEQLINIIVGDTLRLNVYGKKGFHAFVQLPAHINEALDLLIQHGYDRHLPEI
jgi:uncharacterized SAM-binding protein YcdF (DUF218 family)